MSCPSSFSFVALYTKLQQGGVSLILAERGPSSASTLPGIRFVRKLRPYSLLDEVDELTSLKDHWQSLQASRRLPPEVLRGRTSLASGFR